RERIHRLEDKVRRRVHIGGYITLRKLLDELVALGEPEALVMRALCALDAQGEFQLRRERSVVYR
ncbi:DNA helicase, partial [Haematococcus lacustris]